MYEPNNVAALLLIAGYMFPAIIAACRRHNNQNAIAMLNILLGWTLLGWVVALIWASTNDVKPPSQTRWRWQRQPKIRYSSVEEYEQAMREQQS